MFVRLDKDLPADPSYPADLAALGYKVNEKGEFVKVDDPTGPHKHFTFFVSDNERVNEVHKEAMHIAARDTVTEELARLGVKQVYLTGQDGVIVEETKPEAPHLTLYATDLDLLNGKANVVVIVGEHNQDPGVFAYRVLMREGGIDKGSAVGIVKRLQNIRFGCCSTDPDDIDVHSNFSKASTEVDSVLASSTTSYLDSSPGIIILNPGQLNYSYAENKCMTWATWTARHRPSAISKPCQVHKTHNRIPGHTSTEEHINTVFDHVIPQLVNRAANVQVIAITDGAEGFVKWFNGALESEEETIANQIRAMAFMQPTHNITDVTNEAARINLKYDARSYIKSASPLGKFINSPDATVDFRSEQQKEEDRIDEEMRVARVRARREAALLEEEESHAGVQPVVVARAGSAAENGAVVGDEPVDVSTDIDEDDMSDSLEMRALGRSIEEFKAREAATAAVREAEIADAAAARSVVTADDYVEDGDEEVDAGVWEEGYDYETNFVSCPTFSAGVADIDELILPSVAESVVEWLSWRAGQEE